MPDNGGAILSLYVQSLFGPSGQLDTFCCYRTIGVSNNGDYCLYQHVLITSARANASVLQDLGNH
ncbi:hypothetical protein O9929_02800 [Vibrio lentus]|nr:hypothetical protein [Vibrio lentus]